MRRRHPAHTRRLLARNLRNLRLQREWSQDDLAEAAGVRQALVSALEVASANPTVESLDKIAAALGVEVANMLLPPGKVIVKRPATSAKLVPGGWGAAKARYRTGLRRR